MTMAPGMKIPAVATRARCTIIGASRQAGSTCLFGSLAEGELMEAQHQRTECDREAGHEGHGEPGVARERRGDDQELAGEDAEWRQSDDRHDGGHQQPAEQRLTRVRPRISAIFCVPSSCAT